MTVLEVIQRSSEFLERKGVESPRLQAELLLAHVLHMPRLKLYLEFERRLQPPELDAVRELVKRRGERVPLQHLLGRTSFCGLELKVTPAALIPRPETELLAELGWTFLRERVTAGVEAPLALDLGTGTGCLAIALAVQCPEARVHAVDLTPETLGLARENAERHRVAERIEFFQGDWFAPLPAGTRYDLIVSNPPYIPTSELDALPPEVRDHDPRPALDGGADGLAPIRRLAGQGLDWLADGGRLMIELGHDQAAAVKDLLTRQGWAVEALHRDAAGFERVCVAARGKS